MPGTRQKLWAKLPAAEAEFCVLVGKFWIPTLGNGRGIIDQSSRGGQSRGGAAVPQLFPLWTTLTYTQNTSTFDRTLWRVLYHHTLD